MVPSRLSSGGGLAMTNWCYKKDGGLAMVHGSLVVAAGLLSIGVTWSGKGLHSGVAGLLMPACPSTEWSLLDAGLPWRIGHGACDVHLWILCSHLPTSNLLAWQDLCYETARLLTWELIYGLLQHCFYPKAFYVLV